MDSQSAGLDFAIIGHQDSWQSITTFMNAIRNPGLTLLSNDTIQEIFPFIPPRDLFRIKVKSKTGTEVQGFYVETFISPDKLNVHNVRANINKVIKAIDHSKKWGAKIITLGGFTSIVLEGNIETYFSPTAMLTTGNTLTAAFIAKGIEAASDVLGITLSGSILLIAGATGDIGMACIRYFKNKVKGFLLCARNSSRLQKLCDEMRSENIEVNCSTNLQDLVPSADVIICVTSSTDLKIENPKRSVLVCDAGYPKNLVTGISDNSNIHLFHGGMGYVHPGFTFCPDYSESFYQYPKPFISHGCVLEAIVLAFEKRFEPYSSGKGNITSERMEEIYQLGLKNGITLAPFYNANGLWE